MEWNEMNLNGMEHNGLEWNGMEQNQIERIGNGREGIVTEANIMEHKRTKLKGTEGMET